MRAGDNVGLGLVFSITSILVFGVQDAISKLLVQEYSPFQVVMIRYWGFCALALLLALRQGPVKQAFASPTPWLQVIRGLLLLVDIWLFAAAIRTVPLAELQAISLVYPFVVTIAAIPLLGERVGVFRLSAIAVGFCGALVILRPGGLAFDSGVVFAFGAATAYALYIVLTRRVAKSDSTPTSMLYTGVVGVLLSTAVGVFYWQPMDARALLIMAVLVITMCVGHGLMMKALSLAPASALQPFNYLSLPWGITLSFVVFGHLIDPISLVGAAIIAGAGLVVMARERRRSGTPAAPAEVVGGPHD